MRRVDGKLATKCIKDGQGLPDLRRRLSGFQLGKKPHTNTRRRSKLILS